MYHHQEHKEQQHLLLYVYDAFVKLFHYDLLIKDEDIANKVSIYDDTISIFKLYSTNYFYAI